MLSFKGRYPLPTTFLPAIIAASVLLPACGLQPQVVRRRFIRESPGALLYAPLFGSRSARNTRAGNVVPPLDVSLEKSLRYSGLFSRVIRVEMKHQKSREKTAAFMRSKGIRQALLMAARVQVAPRHGAQTAPALYLSVAILTFPQQRVLLKKIYVATSKGSFSRVEGAFEDAMRRLVAKFLDDLNRQGLK